MTCYYSVGVMYSLSHYYMSAYLSSLKPQDYRPILIKVPRETKGTRSYPTDFGFCERWTTFQIPRSPFEFQKTDCPAMPTNTWYDAQPNYFLDNRITILFWENSAYLECALCNTNILVANFSTTKESNSNDRDCVGNTFELAALLCQKKSTCGLGNVVST